MASSLACDFIILCIRGYQSHSVLRSSVALSISNGKMNANASIHVWEKIGKDKTLVGLKVISKE